MSCLVGNIVGALIPDMDQAGNRLWDLLPLGDHLAKVFRKIFYKHRTLTHSLVGMFLIYKLLDYALPKFINSHMVDVNLLTISIMIGYISHLIADSLTKEGLPLFFPIGFELGFPPIRALRITTGKWQEKYLVFPVVGIYIVFISYVFNAELVSILRQVH